MITSEMSLKEVSTHLEAREALTEAMERSVLELERFLVCLLFFLLFFICLFLYFAWSWRCFHEKLLWWCGTPARQSRDRSEAATEGMRHHWLESWLNMLINPNHNVRLQYVTLPGKMWWTQVEELFSQEALRLACQSR